MTQSAARAVAARILSRFEEAGAVAVECGVLQPAGTLLDLYGENIRTRTYVTTDPVQGEVMLRPDFTVPVVQRHMSDGAEPARYTYAGEVFRRQETYPDRPSEFLQVGFELFDRSDPEMAEAEVFALFSDVLAPHGLRAVTGDIGVLKAAIAGLRTTDARKAALLRHIWRPRRFRALLDRYSGRVPVPPHRQALLEAADPMAEMAVHVGLRSVHEIETRIAALQADAKADPLSREEVALIERLLSISAHCPDAIAHLHDLSVHLPAITSAVGRLGRRMAALKARNVDLEVLHFEASYGRSSMEYYDGFVFGFVDPDRPDWPPVASGGRYDALTRHLGQGREIPAVGGVIRPDLVQALEGQA